MHFFSEPPDVYSAVYSLIWVNRLLGTAPFLLTKPPNRKFKINHYLSMMSVIEILVICGTMWYLMADVGDNIAPISQYFKICNHFFFGIISSVYVLFGILRAKYLILGFKMMYNIDQKLKTLGVWMCYRETRNKILIQLTIVFLILFILFIGFLNILVQVPWANLSTFINCIPQSMIILVELQYYDYLYLAMVRYKILNEYLITLDKDKDIFRNTTRLPSVNKKRKDRQLSAGILKTTNLLSNPYTILETVNDLHIQLTDMCNNFNKAFSVQLLVRVGTSFIAIISSLFFIIGDMGSFFNYYRDNIQMLSVVIIFTLTFSILELYSLARISDITCQEANNCPLLLHKIKHNCVSTDLLNAIELYSIQMYHNKLQFNVCGLFPIDNTLLYTMSGSVTTYLIFLVQLSKSEVFRNVFKQSNITNETHQD